MTWDAEQVELVVSLWNEGASAREISDIIGATRNAILGIVHRQRSKLVKRETKIAAIPERRIYPGSQHSKPLFPGAWEPLPGIEPVPLAEIHAGQCRWPIGEPFHGLLCGAETEAGSYCPEHTRKSTRRVE